MATTARKPATNRTALDSVLTDAVLGDGEGVRRFLRPRAAMKVAARLARRPDRVVRRGSRLASELAGVATRSSERTPEKGDRRFRDPAWETNWLLRRLMQGYLAASEATDGLLTDAELDWQTERQARFAVGNVVDLMSPTNNPLLNPVVLRETIDRGGANLVNGARRLAADASWPPRLPASVDTSMFELGENLALTPGSVVLRTDVFELIQYRPVSERVYEVPLLFVPPTINRYYVLDLAPGRSLVEYLVGEGHQVFMISWRNPGADQAHFDFDTYAGAVLDARDAVAEISRQEGVHLNGVCSGGMLAAGALAHLAAQDRLAEATSLALTVCAIDSARAGTASALLTRESAAAAIAASARKGYVDGQALAGVFAWLRPNDLIWNYVINNYLLGKSPPAFDVLYWNQDSVRLSAGLHRDFIRLSLDNSLAHPGEAEVLGDPVDLGTIDLDSYVVAASKDHIVPWENAYQSTQLLGGRSRFVLSTSGHIQAVVNPPGEKSKSSYRTAEEHPAATEDFLDAAAMNNGSWWPDYAAWLAERSGERKPAPPDAGSHAHPGMARAPGSYVHAG